MPDEPTPLDPKSKLDQVSRILESLLVPELLNEVILPDKLSDPGAESEITERYNFIYHRLHGPLALLIQSTLSRQLSTNEMGFIGERLEIFLKQNGF